MVCLLQVADSSGAIDLEIFRVSLDVGPFEEVGEDRQLLGIHCVNGRRGWDRTDVEYLPEHKAIADAKKL